MRDLSKRLQDPQHQPLIIRNNKTARNKIPPLRIRLGLCLPNDLFGNYFGIDLMQSGKIE